MFKDVIFTVLGLGLFMLPVVFIGGIGFILYLRLFKKVPLSDFVSGTKPSDEDCDYLSDSKFTAYKYKDYPGNINNDDD